MIQPFKVLDAIFQNPQPDVARYGIKALFIPFFN